MSSDGFMASLDLPEVYRVGGSVRDELLGRPSKDYDYMVRGANIEQITEALLKAEVKSVRPLKLRDGRQVGVRFPHAWGLTEVVLPRKEVSTGPRHRDFHIVGHPRVTVEQDAQRRDFTINALYRDVRSGEILDPLGGLTDLECQCIRTTHPDSFRDDPLRTLRALRFVSQLGFDLQDSTYRQMRAHAKQVNALTLKGVSGTALDELCKLLMGTQPARALRLMRDTGVLPVLLPELASIVGFEQRSAYHDKPLDGHTFDAIQTAAESDASLRVRLALLFHDAGKPWMAWRDAKDALLHYYALTVEQVREHNAPPTAVKSHEWWGAWLAGQALDRLNAPADLRRDVITLIERHMLPLHGRVKAIKVRRWRAELGDALLSDLILHRACDADAKGDGPMNNDAESALADIQSELRFCQEMGVSRHRSELRIRGVEIADLGVKGVDIGRVYDMLLEECMAQPKLNEHEWLLSRAATLARRL